MGTELSEYLQRKANGDFTNHPINVRLFQRLALSL